MPVSHADVEHVARLARLALSEAETADMATQLTRILEHVAMLNELDTRGVEPLTHPFDAWNVVREDVPRPSLTQAEALANAPSSAEAHFLVPDARGGD